MQLNQRPLGLETLNGTGVAFAGPVPLAGASGVSPKGTRTVFSSPPLVSGSSLLGSGRLAISGSSVCASQSGISVLGTRLLFHAAGLQGDSTIEAIPTRLLLSASTDLTCSSGLSATPRRTLLTTGFLSSESTLSGPGIVLAIGSAQLPSISSLASDSIVERGATLDITIGSGLVLTSFLEVGGYALLDSGTRFDLRNGVVTFNGLPVVHVRTDALSGRIRIPDESGGLASIPFSEISLAGVITLGS